MQREIVSDKVAAQQVGHASACRLSEDETNKHERPRWIEDEVEELERWDGLE